MGVSRSEIIVATVNHGRAVSPSKQSDESRRLSHFLSIFFVIVAKILCYNAMTLRCTDYGVQALAAQTILMRIWFFFGCTGDAISQTAQSFIPAAIQPTFNRKTFNRIFLKLFTIAGGLGLVSCLTSGYLLGHLGQYLTKDMGIVKLMQTYRWRLSGSLQLHVFTMLLEGTVIASRDFASLIFTYSTTLALHFSILRFFCNSFADVWRTFVIFQTTRLVLYGARVWRSQRRQRAQKPKGTNLEASR